jgi:uncharacterized protein
MEFEWDNRKNAQNPIEHGISFQEAQTIFDGNIFQWIDDRFDYGEIRETSIGAIQSVVIIVVVHTERNGITRIISARKATRKEREEYYDYLITET